MVLTLVNNPKNLTIYIKRLPKKIYIKLKILNICYDSDRNICACLYTGSYYQCYATLLQNVFNLDTYLYILSCIFIVSIKITTTTTAMPVPRRCIADGRVCQTPPSPATSCKWLKLSDIGAARVKWTRLFSFMQHPQNNGHYGLYNPPHSAG